MDRKALSAQIKSCAGNKLFPGGMSAQKFYATSRAQGMDITLEQAKELLRDPDRSITDIAYDLGWSSSNYFCAVFKKYTNISPLHYRKLRMQMDDEAE